MLSGEMARYQIADRVREAEADRLARSTRRARSSDRTGLGRRVGRAFAALRPVGRGSGPEFTTPSRERRGLATEVR